ncbi:MAG TPA: helix-turn-helix domain-containing protein [Terracidiphilus sp.]|nr:helix-turn-helix domain-containing protein [Terracidiphilus sp.]
MHTVDLPLTYQPSALQRVAKPTHHLPSSPIEHRKRVRCGHCELTQWEAVTCRRCHLALPAPLVEYVEVEKPVPVIKKELVAVQVVREVLVPVEQPCLRCAGLSLAASETSYRIEGADNFPSLEEMERTLIQAALDRSGGDRQKAAHLLGIGKTTIYRKLKEYGMAAMKRVIPA